MPPAASRARRIVHGRLGQDANARGRTYGTSRGCRLNMRSQVANADIAPERVAAPAAAPAKAAGDLTFRTYASAAAIPRSAWERMLPGEPESWDFYSAIESVPPPGFQLGAVAALDGRSEEHTSELQSL